MSRSKRLNQYYRGRHRLGFSPPDFDCDPDSDTGPDRIGDAGLVIYGSRQIDRKSTANDSCTCETLAASLAEPGGLSTN